MNSYVLYKETASKHPAVNDDEMDTHKEFLIEFTNALIRRAQKESTAHSAVTRQETPVGEVTPVIHLNSTRQPRFSRTRPSLSTFDHVRFIPGKHQLIAQKQRPCKYCQYLVAIARVKKEPLPEEKRPYLECQICKVSLCKNHMDKFHAR